MKILSWNIRGLGASNNSRPLLFLIKEKKPNVVFVMETKLIAGKVEKLKRKLSLDGCFVVNPIGKGAGLALWWSGEVNLEF